MRLTPAQIDTIKSTASAVLGEGVQVWLYGSRLDDQRRGGDVDLLVQTARKASVMDRARFKYQVESTLQLPVDVLMVQTGQNASPFETIARSKAVELTLTKGMAA
jgi:predicted nucleotidyltransferase